MDPATGEVTSLRTQFSRTYEKQGRFEQVAYAAPVNFLDPSGAWQAIDNHVIPSSAASATYTNAANAFHVTFPTSLSNAPVTVNLPQGTISFSISGASGTATVQGNSVTYAGAITATDVTYAVTSGGLKESIVLLSPDAPTTIRDSVSVSPGLAIANVGGGWVVEDSSGRTVFALDALTAKDASGASIALDVNAADVSGQDVTFAIQLAGAQPGSAWPVTIDPGGSTYQAATNNCQLQQSLPTTTSCNPSSDSINGTTSGANVERALLQFSVASIPNNVDIEGATLQLNLTNTPTSATNVGAYPITRTWTNANWNTYDGTHSWTTLGGDMSSTAAGTASSGTAPGLVNIPISNSLVQGWVSAGQAFNGLAVRLSNESVLDLLQFSGSGSSNPPNLTTSYTSRTGLTPFYDYVQSALTDKSTLYVNVGTGNLVLQNHDVHISSTGLDYSIDRYYNSGWYGPTSSPQSFGGGRWRMSTGDDVTTGGNEQIPLFYDDPTGHEYVFSSSDGVHYQAPPGLDADFSYGSGSVGTLTLHPSQLQLLFNGGPGVTSEVDANGNTMTNQYSSSNSLLITSATDSEGRGVTFSRTNPSHTWVITSITDSTSRSIVYGYDSSGDLTTYNDANNKQTTYAYTGGEVTTITDPQSNVTNLAYDSWGDVTSITRVTGGGTGPTTTFSYNFTSASGCTSSSAVGSTLMTDPNGHQTRYCFDSTGRVVQTIDAYGNSSSTLWNTSSQVSSASDAYGNSVALGYDSNQNPTSSAQPPTASGQTAATGNWFYPTFQSGANDSYRATSSSDPTLDCQAMAYDSVGNLTDVYTGLTAGTNAQGQSTGCSGQTGGVHVSNALQGDGTTTCGAHRGEVCTSKNGKGGTTSYGYDAGGKGMLTSITPPSPQVQTTVSYDGLNRPSVVTDGRGQVTRYTYDNNDRVTQMLFAGTTTCSSYSTCTTYSYDGDGNVLTRIDVTGTTTYKYDALNRLTDEAAPSTVDACSGSSPLGITFGYDAASNRTTVCDARGTSHYGYDNDNRLIALAEPGGSLTSAGACSTNPCTSFAYDNDSRRTTTTFPGGATMTLSYDNAGNVASAVGKSSAAAILTDFTYSHASGTKDAGRVVTRTENDALATNLTTTYSYTASAQLSKATNTSATYNYSYDADGNVCRTDGLACQGAADPYQYNTDNELTSNASITFSYDGAGNLTGSSSGASLSYNAEEQTTATTFGGTTLSPQTYAGTGQNERTTSGSTTYGNDALGIDESTVGTSHTYFMWDTTNRVVGEKTPDGNRWYFLRDGEGSVVAVIDDSGSTVADRFAYDPYGATTTKTGSIADPWGYVSGFTDANGLIKFGTRYYDPGTRRWTQEDPLSGALANPRALDRYTYAVGDPLNNVDPAGMWSWRDFGEATGAAIVLGAGAGCAVGALATIWTGPGAGVGCGIGAATGAVSGLIAGAGGYAFTQFWQWLNG